jgi:hypothetical protein
VPHLLKPWLEGERSRKVSAVSLVRSDERFRRHVGKVSDSQIRSVNLEPRSLVSFSNRDFACALQGVKLFSLLWIKHVVDLSLETRVAYH